jgi:NAD(P)-dependent dehydrogenase (short-subunit alcohol dehydrogenase family)
MTEAPAPSRAVLITGCSTGIGRATAEHLLEQGWTVYATARRLRDIAELEAAGAQVLELDVTNDRSMARAVKEVERREGAVGVLINNAGYSQNGAVEEVPLDDVRRQFETNVNGLVRMCQLVLPGMRAQGWGRIVNLSSMGGRMSLPGGAFYHGTKHAVEAISDVLRFEVRPFGVKVVIVEPGPVITNFGSTSIASVDAVKTNGDSPYAAFTTQVARITEGAYEKPSTFGAVRPEKVARTIEKAISKPRPRARYPVGALSRTLMGLKRFLPTSGFDFVLRRQFPQPQPVEEDTS